MISRNLYTLAQRLQMRAGTVRPGLTHEFCHTHFPMWVPVIQTQPSSCLCDKHFTMCTPDLTPDSLAQGYYCFYLITTKDVSMLAKYFPYYVDPFYPDLLQFILCILTQHLKDILFHKEVQAVP